MTTPTDLKPCPDCMGTGSIKHSPNPDLIGSVTCPYCKGTGKENNIQLCKIPEPKEWGKLADEQDSSYRQGWNDCIDAIDTRPTQQLTGNRKKLAKILYGFLYPTWVYKFEDSSELCKQIYLNQADAIIFEMPEWTEYIKNV